MEDQNARKNFRTAALLFFIASALMGLSGILISQPPMRRMFLILCLVFFISGVTQAVLFKTKGSLFKDKSSNPD